MELARALGVAAEGGTRLAADSASCPHQPCPDADSYTPFWPAYNIFLRKTNHSIMHKKAASLLNNKTQYHQYSKGDCPTNDCPIIILY